MLKLTKTGIGLLTKQYRSVLKKCLIANLCILYPLTSDAQYATLNGDNTFTGTQYLNSSGYTRARLGLNSTYAGGELYLYGGSFNNLAVDLHADTDSGGITFYNKANLRARLDAYGDIGRLFLTGGNGQTTLTPTEFQLNSSSVATGIDFAANITAGTTNASHLATTGAVNQLLNYYYTFRNDENVEIIYYASFFK